MARRNKRNQTGRPHWVFISPRHGSPVSPLKPRYQRRGIGIPQHSPRVVALQSSCGLIAGTAPMGRRPIRLHRGRAGRRREASRGPRSRGRGAITGGCSAEKAVWGKNSSGVVGGPGAGVGLPRGQGGPLVCFSRCSWMVVWNVADLRVASLPWRTAGLHAAFISYMKSCSIVCASGLRLSVVPIVASLLRIAVKTAMRLWSQERGRGPERRQAPAELSDPGCIMARCSNDGPPYIIPAPR